MNRLSRNDQSRNDESTFSKRRLSFSKLRVSCLEMTSQPSLKTTNQLSRNDEPAFSKRPVSRFKTTGQPSPNDETALVTAHLDSSRFISAPGSLRVNAGSVARTRIIPSAFSSSRAALNEKTDSQRQAALPFSSWDTPSTMTKAFKIKIRQGKTSALASHEWFDHFRRHIDK